MTTNTINAERLWSMFTDVQYTQKKMLENKNSLPLAVKNFMEELIISKMIEAKLDVFKDKYGNIIGCLPGMDDTKPIVLTGSYIYTGNSDDGKVDGFLGVLSGIEVLHTIGEQNKSLSHSIKVIAVTNRNKMVDAHNEKLQLESLVCIQADKKFSSSVNQKENNETVKKRKCVTEVKTIKAYIELLLDQSGILEMENLSVGIVTNVQGIALISTHLKIENSQTGSTPMFLRSDTTMALAEALLAIEKIAIKWDGLATVGKIDIKPGKIDIIPEEIQFIIDFRHFDKMIRDHMQKEIISSLKEITTKRGVEFYSEVKYIKDPESCSPSIIGNIEAACWNTNIPAYKMKSGIEHNGLLIKGITDFGLIFVRSANNIDNNSTEHQTKLEDCVKGADVLYHTLVQLAK